MKRLGNGGDTIVEILLVMAVVGSVLGGAYNSANNSLGSSRQAQERAEALKIAEGQMEEIKSLGASASSSVYDASPPSCLGSAAATSCTDNSFGVPYNVSITRTGNATDGYIFAVSVVWERFNGQGNDNVRIIYKLFPTTS